MQNSMMDSSYVNRLKQILASRYGKGLHIRQLMDLSEIRSESAFTRGRDLHIPLQVNGAIFGTAVVPSADDLNLEKREGVTQLVKLVLEPAMYKWYLDQKESNLNEITKAQLELENVHVFGDDPAEETDDEDLDENPESLLVSHLIHLHGHSENKNKKVALQLHELTKNWAFVPFSDIKGQLHSSQDIAKLGAMTIFVENAEHLNPAEQELLLEYVSEERGANDPLILTSSLKTIEELTQLELASHLVDEMSINCFEVDKAPLTNSSLKEVLELFFLKDSPLDA